MCLWIEGGAGGGGMEKLLPAESLTGLCLSVFVCLFVSQQASQISVKVPCFPKNV